MSFLGISNPFASNPPPAAQTAQGAANAALGGSSDVLFACEAMNEGCKPGQEAQQRKALQGKMASGMDPSQDPAIAAALNPQTAPLESSAALVPLTATAAKGGIKAT